MSDTGIITPPRVEYLLTKAFPGASLVKGDAIGRRKTFSLAFGPNDEFSIMVVCPEAANMHTGTTFTFRRRVSKRTLHRVNEALDRDQLRELGRLISDARGYVLGIYYALHAVLEEPESEEANILG